ncbi:MAG: hypothetical protein KatS3mg102_2789 [Planctomycetota bacterium]|nr:MAG: hypothetical protein KatS3mg102_2789 [Planctomycetota bacterium]
MTRRVAIKTLLVGTLVLAAVWCARHYAVHTIGEEAAFMSPAVEPPSLRLLAGGPGQLPPRGAVVWLDDPRGGGRALLARVVGVPGDRIAVEGGRLIRNGEPVAEPYAQELLPAEELAEIVVPAWHVYVLNDRRGARGSFEVDSRGLGPLAAAHVRGWFGAEP